MGDRSDLTSPIREERATAAAASSLAQRRLRLQTAFNSSMSSAAAAEARVASIWQWKVSQFPLVVRATHCPSPSLSGCSASVTLGCNPRIVGPKVKCQHSLNCLKSLIDFFVVKGRSKANTF
jgi:hypothetical protein